MKHTKHKKFKLLSHKDNYSIVMDTTTGTEHSCFRLEHNYVGDNIYLFIKDIDNYTGTYRFEYSVLNIYEVGKTYEFDIIEERDTYTLISNHPNKRLSMPNSFLLDRDEDKISLKIHKLDLDKNKVYYQNKDYDAISVDDFEEGKIYNLKLLSDYINKNDTRFAVVKYKNKRLRTNLPKALNHIKLDPVIPFWLGFYEENNEPTLNIDRSYTVRRLYNIGTKYKFKISEIEYNVEDGTTIWHAEDSYGMYNYYYPDRDLSAENSSKKYEEGDEIELYVSGFTNRGFLYLVYNYNEIEVAKYLVEDLFDEIGYSDKEDEYFFDEDLIIGGLAKYEDKDTQNYIEQYNEGENLWVFSYLTYLDKKIYLKLEEGEYDLAKTFLDIYIKIEDWILNKSDYLANFRKSTRENIIQKAKSKIDKYKATIQAIDLFIEGKEEEFIEKIQDRLDLYVDPNSLNTFKELVRVSLYFSGDTDSSIIQNAIMDLIKHKHISEHELVPYIKSVESKIRRVKTHALDNIDINDNELDKDELLHLIKNLYLLVILNSLLDDSYKVKVSVVEFLRLLTLYTKDVKYLDLGIQIILNRAEFEPDLQKNLFISDFDYETLSKMIVKPEVDRVVYRNSGTLIFDKGLFFIPRNHYTEGNEPKTLIQLKPFDLYIQSEQIQNEIDFNSTNHTIVNQLLDIVKLKSKETSVNIDDLNKEKEYVGRIKIVHKTYCFIEAYIDNVKTDILYHINNFNSLRIFYNLQDILKPDDYLNFRIKKYDEKRKKFVIEGLDYDIRSVFADNIVNDQEYLSVILQRSKNMNFGITELGNTITFYDSEANVGDRYLVKMGDFIEKYQEFEVVNYKPTTKEFDLDIALLFKTVLSDIGQLVEISKVDERLEITKEVRILIIQLINSLEQRLNYVTDKKELTLNYFFLATLSSTIRLPKSYEYISKLKQIQNAERFTVEKDFHGLMNMIDDEDVEFQGKDNNSALQILQYINSSLIDLPIPSLSDFTLQKLKKLVESYNLFKNHYKTDIVTPLFEKLIVDEFYNVILKREKDSFKEIENLLSIENSDELESKAIDFGRETQYKEFKSSFFYSASEVQQDEVILRTIAGFLNAYEGTGVLYIGINDSGKIIGIANDLKYSPRIKNIDQYQNHIQSRITSVFPKIINTEIKYKFHNHGKNQYLEIEIPSQKNPIPLRDEFYQRQGVQTRILKGQDLLDFISRKQTIPSPYNPIPMQTEFTDSFDKIDLINDGKENNELTLFDDAMKKDLYEDLKRESKVIKIDYESETKDKFLGYLYIFNNNSYRLSNTDLSEYKEKIAITEEYRLGYILLCYDNGCVNKVEVRSVLSKSFNRDYKNALSDYGKLLKVLLVNKDDEIIVVSQRLKDDYAKVFKVDNISAHRTLGLKGNCILQDDFDFIHHYYKATNLSKNFNRFRRKSKQNLGEKVDKYKLLYNKMIELVE